MKIISGGQTGADRGALDFAIEHGFEHGGWCPKGRLAEDGPIPLKYNLKETESDKYPPRTAANIKEADATIIFNSGRLMERGCALTLELCYQMHKPFWICSCSEQDINNIKFFINHHKPKVLNIAGNRESKAPGIHKFVMDCLSKAILNQS